MKRSKDNLIQEAAQSETETEEGVTFISEVVKLPETPVVAAVDTAPPVECCGGCGSRNLVDIRRSYYCAVCGKVTSK
jgi:hypothetical protein